MDIGTMGPQQLHGELQTSNSTVFLNTNDSHHSSIAFLNATSLQTKKYLCVDNDLFSLKYPNIEASRSVWASTINEMQESGSFTAKEIHEISLCYYRSQR